MQRLVVLVVLAVTMPASAGPRRSVHLMCDPVPCPYEPPLEPQIQADVGLSVLQAAYEYPFGRHVSASLSAGIFGSYFLPWFDLGDDVLGVGGGFRVTWFARASGRGPYIAPYVRVHRVSGHRNDMAGNGLGVSAGAFAGWAFGLTDRLDLRLGLGAQYFRHSIETPEGKSVTSAPFIALDILVGYRL